MELRDLYQEVILDHNRSPRNFGDLPERSHHAEGFNPLCGDRVGIELRMSEDGVIEEVRFHGSGCAISTASASMLTEAVRGKSRDEALTIIEGFTGLVRDGSSTADLGKLAVFAGVCEFPTRVKCATLAWHTMKSALQGESSSVSTE